MMETRMVVTVVVVVVMLVVFGYLVHGVLLAREYQKLSGLYRGPDEQRRYLPLMMPAHILAAIALVWLYSRVQGPGSWLAEGVRFGLAVAVLMTVHKFLIYYTVQPVTGGLVVKQIVFDTIAALIIALVIAALAANPSIPIV